MCKPDNCGSVFLAALEDLDDAARSEQAATDQAPHLHMVMVPNPAYHPSGDFVLSGDRLTLDEEPAKRTTFGNIALYRTSLFRELPPPRKLNMLPLYREWIARGWASGELFVGDWANVGTPGELAVLDSQLLGNLPSVTK